MIFLHSHFRTGSTYIWHKFRENRGMYCFYEPFHEILAILDRAYLDEFNAYNKVTKINRHPDLKSPYFDEYKKFFSGKARGVPFFKKTFSYDEFLCTDDNPDLVAYIDFLVNAAGTRTPFFKFTRTSMRVSWFTKNYPDSINIYLYRNPRDQWQSYINHLKTNNNPYFMVRDIMIAGKNAGAERFRPLAGMVPLLSYSDNDAAREDRFYSLVFRPYTIEEQYTIFYYIWLTNIIENILHADYLLAIDTLCSDPEERTHLNDFLKSRNIGPIDFADARIKSYSSYELSETAMERIEEEVRNRMSDSMAQEMKDGLAGKMPGAPVIQHYIKNLVDRREVPDGEGSAACAEKVKTRLSEMAMDMAKHCVDILSEKESQVQAIYDSYTYRFGNLFLNPIKQLVKIKNRILNR